MIRASDGGDSVAERSIPHGSAELYLAPGVAFISEGDAVFGAMLTGWGMQQLGGRGLGEKYVVNGGRLIRRFAEFSGDWPWEWSAHDFDEWMTDLVSRRKLAPSTLRKYQNYVRDFCNYITSEHYGWASECLARFGTHPVQICHSWNVSKHLQDYEGRPGRRPLTRAELQALMDHADAEYDRRLTSGRKGALPAYRDATLLKVLYGWGLRVNEAVHLDITDFYRNPQAPEFGEFGVLLVRFGKANQGRAPKRRSVVTLDAWAVDAVKDYVENIRPLMGASGSDALWFSERGTRLRTREIQDRFAEYCEQIGLDENLSPHGLRHSYVTHHVEDGFDFTFIQQQVGHSHPSTTSLYAAVTGDFANKMMAKALERMRNHADPTEGLGK
jgi:site-specific recombinase XerD